ncbi:long-chain-alcohol O-fatty-acyltransferase-like [Tripterygium wilfordii]|uniref:long-chain-alcohol O-fatty-acyltransferase-like n=1 Tax=Tripterygium wilfordii TaxID=458696 RepID=UPI0018F85FDE|nr:long-chain-alcohol O-fatty-acyltransferase-like [Tripterygium wilfordii]
MSLSVSDFLLNFPGKQEKMEGEIQRFAMVWASAMLALCYCHTIGRITIPGKSRLIAFLPIVLLFLYLPLNLHTIFLGGPTAFFLSWLATFRLLLFAVGKGPLSSTSPVIPLQHFLLVSCLPIKILQNKSDPSLKTHKSPLNYSVKSLIFATVVPIFQNKDKINPNIIKLSYCIYLYCAIELFLAVIAAMARVWLGVEFEPQFDEPYLATSIQDFWGRRWNLMVTSTLHPTVYDPVRKISARLFGRKFAPLLAVVASFTVSGLMHELIFYYIGRKTPNWELTCFFVLHGVCLAIEVAVKKEMNGKLRLPGLVTGPVVVGFALATGAWLFMPAVLRSEFDVKANRESIAFIEFVKGIGIHPNTHRLM